jgi:hypothetical protein
MGLSFLFCLHAIILVTGLIFVFFTVPETRGLSLSELASLFGGPDMTLTASEDSLVNATDSEASHSLNSTTKRDDENEDLLSIS